MVFGLGWRCPPLPLQAKSLSWAHQLRRVLHLFVAATNTAPPALAAPRRRGKPTRAGQRSKTTATRQQRTRWQLETREEQNNSEISTGFASPCGHSHIMSSCYSLRTTFTNHLIEALPSYELRWRVANQNGAEHCRTRTESNVGAFKRGPASDTIAASAPHDATFEF